MSDSAPIARATLPTNTRVDEVRARFAANYPAYQYRLVEFLTEHLADLSRSFGGDLQEMLVLAIIGQRAIEALKATSAEPGDIPLQRSDIAITASRLADVTGVPRQTVRRKLKALEERGWIERVGVASYRLAQRDGEAIARKDLSDVDRRAMERVARLYGGLERIVNERTP